MQTIRLNVTNVFWGEDANNISLFFYLRLSLNFLDIFPFHGSFSISAVGVRETFLFRSASASARDKNKEDRVRRVEECQKLAIRLSAEGHECYENETISFFAPKHFTTKNRLSVAMKQCKVFSNNFRIFFLVFFFCLER